MTRIVRAALTETCNAYADMPGSVEELNELADKLPAIREANIDHHRYLIEAAKDVNVQALCMGELFAAPYFALDCTPMWKELAEDAEDGQTISAMRETARTLQMLLVAPIYELDAKTGKRFNTAVVIEKDGSILGKYRKCHIPEGTNDAGSFCETFYYERSDGNLDNGVANISGNDYFPVFQSSVGKLGVAICYDRHFPGVVKALAEQGAEIVFSPAVTFGKKSQAMWEMEFPVDATRHNLFIGGSNRVGKEAPWNQDFFGGSYFVGPNGRPDPVQASPGLVVADLDLAQLDDADPSGWNFERDLRPGIY
jgi:N-carbamoylputrescine amidase